MQAITNMLEKLLYDPHGVFKQTWIQKLPSEKESLMELGTKLWWARWWDRRPKPMALCSEISCRCSTLMTKSLKRKHSSHQQQNHIYTKCLWKFHADFAWVAQPPLGAIDVVATMQQSHDLWTLRSQTKKDHFSKDSVQSSEVCLALQSVGHSHVPNKLKYHVQVSPVTTPMYTTTYIGLSIEMHIGSFAYLKVQAEVYCI